MFKNVVVGVEGRPNGRDAIALAAQLIDVDGELAFATYTATNRQRSMSPTRCWSRNSPPSSSMQSSSASPRGVPAVAFMSRPRSGARTYSWLAPAPTARSVARCSATIPAQP